MSRGATVTVPPSSAARVATASQPDTVKAAVRRGGVSAGHRSSIRVIHPAGVPPGVRHSA
ncbi:hypothetical protein [Streptosporangium vulgare]|uniref:hypothetical protein n=1 Tax=Streptosporangium vulgare TaxID=46190 RepID=UPI0036D7D89F